MRSRRLMIAGGKQARADQTYTYGVQFVSGERTIHLRDVKCPQSCHIVVARDGAIEAVASTNDVVEPWSWREVGEGLGRLVKGRPSHPQCVPVAALEPRPAAERQRRR